MHHYFFLLTLIIVLPFVLYWLWKQLKHREINGRLWCTFHIVCSTYVFFVTPSLVEGNWPHGLTLLFHESHWHLLQYFHVIYLVFEVVCPHQISMKKIVSMYERTSLFSWNLLIHSNKSLLPTIHAMHFVTWTPLSVPFTSPVALVWKGSVGCQAIYMVCFTNNVTCLKICFYEISKLYLFGPLIWMHVKLLCHCFLTLLRRNYILYYLHKEDFFYNTLLHYLLSD